MFREIWRICDDLWLVGSTIHMDLLGRWAFLRPFCLVPTAKWAAAVSAKATLWSWGKPCPSMIRSLPIGSMYGIYDNIYHQYIPNVSIYTIHGSYGLRKRKLKWSLNFIWSFLSHWIRAGISNTSCLFQTTTWPAFEHPDGRLVVMGDLFQKIEDDSP